MNHTEPEPTAKHSSPRSGSFATPVALLRGRGSGARRGRSFASLPVLTVLVLLLTLFSAAAGAATRSKLTEICPSGVGAGMCNNPSGGAVNRSGAGGVGKGDYYVVDRGNNRVEEFSSAGAFVRGFGMSVAGGGAGGSGIVTSGSASVTSVTTLSKAFLAGQRIEGTGIAAGTTITAVGATTLTLSQPATAAATGALTALSSPADPGNVPVNAKQVVTVPPAALSGNFKLSFTAPNPQPAGASPKITENIPFNATPVEVEAALKALTNLGSGNVVVTLNSGGDAGGGAGPGGPWTVEFTGSLADVNVSTLVQSAGTPNLSTGTVAISAIQEGATAAEACSTSCTTGASVVTPGGLTAPLGVAIDQANGNVYVYDGIAGASNRRIDVFSAKGAFEGAFAWNVISGGAEGTGTVTNGSTSVTGVATTKKAFLVGQAISGIGIAPGTSIKAVGATTLTLSQPATAAATGAGTALTAPEVGGNVAGNERQTVTLPAGTTGGTFTLTFKVAAPSESTATATAVPFNATAAEVKAKLEGLANVGAGNVEVTGATGGPWTVEFKGTRFADTNVEPMTASGAGLTPAGTVAIATIRDGGSLELCTTSCLAAAESASAGAVAAGTGGSRAPAVDSSGNVYLPGGGNLRVDEFSPTLNPSHEVTGISFVRAIGWDVIPSGQPGDTGTALEVCTAASTCKVGTSGAGAGQFLANNPIGVTVDSENYIYALDTPTTCSVAEPCRVQKFNPDGSFKENFGPASGECQLTFTSGASSGQAATAIAVDPSSNHLFVLKKTAATSIRVCELNNAGAEPTAFPASALPGGPNGLRPGLAVGIDERVYATEGGSFASGAPSVYVLGPVLPPEPEMISVTEVNATEARFNGKVHVPTLSGETTYRFEYSADGGLNWENVPIPDKAIGDASAGGESSTCPAPKAAICAVSDKAKGLQPNRTYLVRLAATTGETVRSEPPLSFKTLPAKPSITHTQASQVTGSSAKLSGFVNPNNSPTTYHFEWGLNTAYGNEAPGFDVFTGSDGQPVPVGVTISGLQLATTYHFRIVATNAFGAEYGPDASFTTNNFPDNCANESIRAQQASTGLPDCRAFEQVSPNDKRPVGTVGFIIITQQGFQAASDGNGMLFPILNGLSDATAAGEVRYVGTRTASGWQSKQVTAPSLVPFPKSPAANGEQEFTSRILYNSPDLSCGFLESYEPLTADTPEKDIEDGVRNLYRRNGDGTYTLISAPVPTNSLSGLSYVVDGAATDCSHVMFHTGYKLLSAATGNALYDWANGELRLTGIRPDGSVAANASAGNPNSSFNTMSTDGTKVVFHATSSAGGDTGNDALFVRKQVATGTGDVAASSASITNVTPTSGGFASGQAITGPGIPTGTTVLSYSPGEQELTLSQQATLSSVGAPLTATVTVDASQSQGPKANNGSTATIYQMATPSGSHVFFTGKYGLAANGQSNGVSDCSATPSEGFRAGCDLYDYDVATGTLTDLSVDSNPADVKGAGVAGLVDASDDGSYVYFAARGQLIPGQGNTESQNLSGGKFFNLYVTHNGQLAFVGLVSHQDVVPNELEDSNLASSFQTWSADATPDGRYLLFTSKANVTGYDSGGVIEAYRYSATADTVVCVSCRSDGQPSIGTPPPTLNATNPIVNKRIAGINTIYQYWYRPRSISDDGRRIFFTMPDALTPGAVEERNNLYEWEAGHVYLLAAGERLGDGLEKPTLFNEANYYIDSSTSGNDVFFVSKAQRTPQDFDNTLDVYDARVGGGFLYTAPPAGCNPLEEKDGCQGPPTTQSSGEAGPASEALAGPGNPPVPRPGCRKGTVSRHGKCVPRNRHKKKHKKRKNGLRGTR